ncbi:MAG: cation transporter [Candidatus Sedimenticola sp. (ex Thyasira tokunagai)]
MNRDQMSANHGAWDASHWINIPSLNHEADGLQIDHILKALSGVHEVNVSISTRKIYIIYDQTQTDFQQIQEKLEEIGFPASNSWWSRKKADWFQYLDTNARANANAPTPPCCSNPKGLNTGKK